MDVRRAMARLPALAGLSASEQGPLADAASVAEFGLGEWLWDRGDAAEQFTFLIAGRVRLELRPDKPCEVLVNLVDQPGQLVCVPAVCSASPHCCRAVCSGPTQVLLIPRDRLLARLDGLAKLLVSQAAEHGMGLCRRLPEIGGSKVQARVIAVLLRLADECGTPSRGGLRLPASLSRRDLAGLSGCATETLIRVLAELERAGALTRVRRSLIVDVDRLATLSHD